MKINNEVLKTYLKQINCNNIINEVKLNFEENGISCLVMNQENTIMVSNKLANSNFIGYEKSGIIVTDNLSLLIKILDRFDGDINIKKDENLLKISNDNRECEFILVSEDFIEDVKKMPNLEYKNILKIDSKTILDSLKNSDIVEDKFSEVKLELKDKTLIIECGYTNKIIDKHKLKDKYENFTVGFNVELLKKTISTIEGEVELHLGKNLPLKIVKITDNSNLFYIIASRLE